MSVLIWVSNCAFQRSNRICSQDQHAQAQHWLRHAQAQLMLASPWNHPDPCEPHFQQTLHGLMEEACHALEVSFRYTRRLILIDAFVIHSWNGLAIFSDDLKSVPRRATPASHYALFHPNHTKPPKVNMLNFGDVSFDLGFEWCLPTQQQYM